MQIPDMALQKSTSLRVASITQVRMKLGDDVGFRHFVLRPATFVFHFIIIGPA